MKIIIFLVCIALASAKVVNQNDCGVVINGISHEKIYLKEYIEKPYQLAIDYNTNVLYFSYTAKRDDVFSLGFLNLKTNGYGTISGVNGGFANGVDQKSHTVYFGGRDGLYKLKPDSNIATNLKVTGKDIWQIFSKDGIYFTTYPNEEAYVYKNGEVSRVNEIGDTRAMLIGVDNADNIIFSNSSGLFYYTKEDRKTTHLGDYTANGITSDINGKIYFSTPTAIYSFDEKNKEVKKVTTIINIYGVAVESDGSFIYASDNGIIRLKSTGKECMV